MKDNLAGRMSDHKKIVPDAMEALWENDLAQTCNMRNRFRWWHGEDKFHGAGCTSHRGRRRD
jgi:hypothetical protein